MLFSKTGVPAFSSEDCLVNAAPQSFAFSKIPTVQRVTDRHAPFEKLFFIRHPKRSEKIRKACRKITA